jgi:hypothetical protein
MIFSESAWVLDIKAAVRQRDGHRCVVCRLGGRTHKKRYGKILEVHRIVPGSNYSIDPGVCVTLCGVCHNALHGKGHWGWIAKIDPEEEWQLAGRVRRSSHRDWLDEDEWRDLEAWGAWLLKLCLARLNVPKGVSPMARLARLSGFDKKSIWDFWAGRRKPLLFEAKRLAATLNVTLDELAREEEVDDGWMELCKQRSHRRALVLRARPAKEGEVEALGSEARRVWEHVGKEDEKRAEKKRVDDAFRRELNCPLPVYVLK